ncbi:hypothetical protein V8G54_007222 [Vigna mungo]|uniref:Uncharacterized protein n=1 Tax=Vigna mungo TaxID=3915 RepID=A0AAQ3P2W9_VIGMU
MVVSIKPFLVRYILQRHIPQINPRLEHLPHLRVHATGVVNHEMRPRPEELHMVRDPLPHALRVQVPVERGTAVQVIVLRLRREQRSVECAGLFRESFYGVGDVEAGVAAAGGRGGEDELPSGVVSIE